MDRAPRDEPVCFVLWLHDDEVGVLAEIPESCVGIARSHGWHVLVMESEMPIGPHDVEPSQSNPRRTEAD